MRYAFYDIKYGLNNRNYPLQSLSYFSTSTKSVSLIKVFIDISLLKMLGYLCLAVIILFLSVCLKKYALTLFLSTALIAILFIGTGDTEVKYILTGPLGLMIGTGFFQGDIYGTDRFTNETTQTFKEIPISILLPIVIIWVSAIVIMSGVILRLRSNAWSTIRKIKVKKAFTLVLTLYIVSSALAGCTNSSEQAEQADYDVYNFTTYYTYENDDYRFSVDESNLDNVKLVYEDKSTGEINDLVRTPFQSSIEVVRSIYGCDYYVYYIKHSVNKSGLKDYYDWTSVIEVDTRTFKEKIIYEENIEYDRSILMGTVQLNKSDGNLLEGQPNFFLDADKNNIYFIGDVVYQLNISSAKVTVIDISTNANVAFDGELIYYIGDRYQLSYYNTVTDEYGKVSDIITTKFILADGNVYYLNRLDNENLYSLSLNNLTTEKILDKKVADFYCDDDYIYYMGTLDSEYSLIQR